MTQATILQPQEAGISPYSSASASPDKELAQHLADLHVVCVFTASSFSICARSMLSRLYGR